MKRVILLSIFAIAYSFCYAQNTEVKQPIEPVQFKVGTPYYVLKAGDKSVGIDTKVDTTFDPNSINPEGIKEINVLKDASATSVYGDKGVNGVVIIVFKESYILPPSLQAKFDETK